MKGLRCSVRDALGRERHTGKCCMPWMFTLILSLAYIDHNADSMQQSSAGPILELSEPSLRKFLDVPRNFKFNCSDGFWRGTFEALNTETSPTHPPVTIVIAYCDHSLDWLDQLIGGLNFRNIVIYSKCGKPVTDVSNIFRVVQLQNVGRVDHTFAYHMATLPEHTDPNEVQLFLKDTYPSFHQVQLHQRGLQEMVHEAAGLTGFSCGSAPHRKNTFAGSAFLSKTWFHSFFNYGTAWSAWHLSSELADFRITNYFAAGGYDARDNVVFANNLTFADWWNALHEPMPGPVIPVCYAGAFAAKPANILASRRIWSRMLNLLERGDNIIEGHFAERTHAAILMPRLPPKIYERILRLSSGVRKCSYTAGYCGLLYGCSNDCD